jgi:hypothetical protein
MNVLICVGSDEKRDVCVVKVRDVYDIYGVDVWSIKDRCIWYGIEIVFDGSINEVWWSKLVK